MPYLRFYGTEQTRAAFRKLLRNSSRKVTLNPCRWTLLVVGRWFTGELAIISLSTALVLTLMMMAACAANGAGAERRVTKFSGRLNDRKAARPTKTRQNNSHTPLFFINLCAL